MRIALEFRTLDLHNGRKSAWLSIELGSTTYWISRWDTARVMTKKPGQRFLWRGKVMTWYCGTH